MNAAILIFAASFGLLFSAPVFAQTVPGSAKAGIVERELDRAAARESAKNRAILFQALGYPETALSIEEGKKVSVKRFEILGNTLFKTAVLDKLVVGYVSNKATFKDLRDACEAINVYYRNRGFFLTRAILPAQDITNGVVKIEVVESRLGNVVVQGSKYYKADFIKKHFFCETKGVVNYHVLLKSLVILNSYPDLHVKAVLRKGKAPYTVDVVLTVEDKRPLHFSADYNNYGSRYVSRNRTGTGVDYSNLIISGDKISIREVNGSPLRTLGYVKTEYSIPVNRYGTRTAVAYAWSRFDVQREFRALDAGGLSQVWSFDVTHPIQKTLTSDMDLLFGLDIKRMKNYLLGQISSNDKLSVLNFGLSGNFLENMLRGRDYYSVVLSQGLKDTFGAYGANDPLASRNGAGGGFFKSNFDVARYQQLPLGWTLLTKASGQLASDVLPVSEQFAIGGLNTVRGFSEAEYLGDEGIVLNAELIMSPPLAQNFRVPFIKKTLKDFMSLVAFIDYGKIYLEHALSGESKETQITGAGFGTRFDFGHDLNLRLEEGFPVSGRNRSAGDKSAVTYVQVQKRF